jgi:formylglycine-generating enzyme required for sulfatase activity
MVDHIRVNRRVSLLPVGFAIAVFSSVPAISMAAARPAQEASPVTYITNDLGMEFAPIPAGQFPMGCSDGVKPVECSPEEKPKHTVQITKPFEFGKTEVTQKQWQSVMGSNPSQRKGDDLPVETITFIEVQAFLAKLNARNDGYLYRLPTEAEWEYAARAGTVDQFGGAKVANSLARYAPPDEWAWYNVEQVSPVAAKKPNAWGLYDIRGNVNEWVQDWYDPRYYSKSPMADPRGPESEVAEGGRVVRSGSFHDDGPWLTRVSLRQHFLEDYKHFDLGFRVVREKR